MGLRAAAASPRVRTAAAALAACGGALFLADCWHVLAVLRERERKDEDFEAAPDAALLEELRRVYSPAPESAAGRGKDARLVDVEAYRARLGEADAKRRELEASGGMLSDPDSAMALALQRESINFAGGGRAALLQLAHPYVANGIVQHSNLARDGAAQRFNNTFLYMFAMLFADPEGSVRASRTVRALHAKVQGTMQEDVGLFSKDSRYDATHAHAVLWVHLTLVETSLLMYELFVQRVSAEDKETFVRATNKFAKGMFGVPDDLLPRDYRHFAALCAAYVASPVLAIGDSARAVDHYVWKPPGRHMGALMTVVRWHTFCMLPARIGSALYGRARTRLDLVLCKLYFNCLPACLPPACLPACLPARRRRAAVVRKQEREGKATLGNN